MARIFFRAGQEIEPRLLAFFHDMVMGALRQLRLALGTGFIFYGFDVQEEPDSGLLQISPGVAFDGEGRPIGLDEPLSLPAPGEAGPLWLCLRYHALVEELEGEEHPLREQDSVEVVWLPSVPRDDETIPLARLQQGPSGWLIDGSVARRAPSLSHRHSNATLPDLSGRLRYDGTPVRLTAPGGEEQRQALLRLETAVATEFAKLNAFLEGISEQQKTQGLEVEELRSEIAEAAERGRPEGEGAEQAAGWQEAIAELREELSLTVGEELREELELLRTEVTTLAERPGSGAGDLGAFTPISALHGVGEAFAQKLRGAGIETVSDLLAAAASPEARERVEATGLGKTRLKRWSREADLLRLQGAGPNEVSLLDSTGITNTGDLATEEPRLLYDRLRVVAADRGDVAAPALAWVQSWVEQAKRLPPVVEW
ncbi:MAG: DUF4332 domain-containing protein [Ardenticatenales bacterium]|nr:DUF4332 domain-containing protein [Ardenticatenales bacterium]